MTYHSLEEFENMYDVKLSHIDRKILTSIYGLMLLIIIIFLFSQTIIIINNYLT
jgi:hypothetical protein